MLRRELFSFDRVRFVTHLMRTLIPMTEPAFIPEDYFSALAPSEIFGEDGLFEVDLGCGDGGFLLQMAAHYPERRFLGIERLLGRVRGVCSRAASRGLDNVKVCRVESRYFLEWLLRPGWISRLHYLFPDPWPKERHHKNRLIQDDFMPVLHRSLADGGEFLFKTDHEEYFWTARNAAACSAAGIGRKGISFIRKRIFSFNGNPWASLPTSPVSSNASKPDFHAFYSLSERFVHGRAPGYA